MTAKQKAARAKFKAVVSEAKKLRKKNPKLTQAQAVKQAWAIEYSKSGKKKAAKKKVGAVKKKAVKKKAVKNKAASKSEYHKDTKSHNVNIRVVSGVNKHFSDYKVYKKHLIDIQKLPNGKKSYAAHGGYIQVPFFTNQLSIAKKFIDRVIAIEKNK